MLDQHEKSFNNKKFLFIVIALVATILIDISLVRINDLINKDLIPMQSKLILFSVNSSLCLLLQYFIIKQVKSSVRTDRLHRTLKVRIFYLISLTSLCIMVDKMCNICATMRRFLMTHPYRASIYTLE